MSEEAGQVYNELPAVQFRSLDAFVADLEYGVVDTLYHDVGQNGARWVSSFRAVVARYGRTHVASLSFHLPTLRAYDERGMERAVEEDKQLDYQVSRHEELVEVVAGRLREIGGVALLDGLVQLPHWTTVVYARRPKVVRPPRADGGHRDA